MKKTIDIPDDVMKDIMKLTKAATKRDAVVGILEDYVRQLRMRELVKRFGKSETFMTHEQLMDMRLEQGKYRGKYHGSR